MSQSYIRANLVKIHPPVHEISCKQESVTLTPTLTPTPTGSAPKTICPPPLRWRIADNVVLPSPAVTLKIRSESPKPNQICIMSQCYIRANLVKIHPPVHEYVPLPFGGGSPITLSCLVQQ